MESKLEIFTDTVLIVVGYASITLFAIICAFNILFTLFTGVDLQADYTEMELLQRQVSFNSLLTYSFFCLALACATPWWRSRKR